MMDLSSRHVDIAKQSAQNAPETEFQRLKTDLQDVLNEIEDAIFQGNAQPAKSTPTQHEFFADMLRASNSLHEKFKSLRLFENPAWLILIDIFVSNSTGRKVTISNACIASQVPTSTALRWIAALEKEGFLIRTIDKRDSRRWFLDLTEKGHGALFEYYASNIRK